jgi:hypothetical protein
MAILNSETGAKLMIYIIQDIRKFKCYFTRHSNIEYFIPKMEGNKMTAIIWRALFFTIISCYVPSAYDILMNGVHQQQVKT